MTPPELHSSFISIFSFISPTPLLLLHSTLSGTCHFRFCCRVFVVDFSLPPLCLLGYHLYAAAVVAKDNTTFGNLYRSQLLTYARSIANPAPGHMDPWFTQTRHMDWFESHSWASGLIANADQRNQVPSLPLFHSALFVFPLFAFFIVSLVLAVCFF